MVPSSWAVFAKAFVCVATVAVCLPHLTSAEGASRKENDDRGQEEDFLVKTPLGVVRGTRGLSYRGKDFYSFRGIPYALPPVGGLRFAPPVPVNPWMGILNATSDGPNCIQKNYLLPGAPIDGQEDCLYVNVYTPKIPVQIYYQLPFWKKYGRVYFKRSVPSALLPVMVYIHGGGWFSGSGASVINGPEYLMDTQDVILVTLNYRLGALGFLSTGDAWATGNWGMKDQVEALRWVRDNILYFGGDPAQVTIFGQSAGAASVHYHMLSPLSKGLFHAAITQSGSALSPWAWPPHNPNAIAQKQGELVGCMDRDSARLIECLRSVPAVNITGSASGFKFWSIDPLIVFGPVIESNCLGIPPCPSQPDDPFLTDHPYNLVAQGRFNPQLPWMVGVVTQEGILRAVPILTAPELTNELNEKLDILGPLLFELPKSVNEPGGVTEKLWNSISDYYLTKTPGGPPSVDSETAAGFIDAYTDRGFLHATHKAVKLHTENSHYPVYFYEFSYRGRFSYTNVFGNTTKNYGVSHCDDLLYLFRTPAIFPDYPPGSPELDVVDQMVRLWTNFAKFKNPTPGGLGGVQWEPVTVGGHRHLSIGNKLKMDEELHEERIAFWDSLPLLENQVSSLWSTLVSTDQRNWMNILKKLYECETPYASGPY